MWGIFKVVITVILVVFLVQLLLGSISNLLNSNTSVQDGLRTSMPIDEEAQFHDIPTNNLWIFVPKPVLRVVVDAKDAVLRLYENGKRAVLRALPVKT